MRGRPLNIGNGCPTLCHIRIILLPCFMGSGQPRSIVQFLSVFRVLDLKKIWEPLLCRTQTGDVGAHDFFYFFGLIEEIKNNTEMVLIVDSENHKKKCLRNQNFLYLKKKHREYLKIHDLWTKVIQIHSVFQFWDRGDLNQLGEQ